MLLDITKIDSGQIEMAEKKFDIKNTIQSCIYMMSFNVPEFKEQVSISSAENLPLFMGDERLFKQIIINLLSNSKKFTPIDGKINAYLTHENNGSISVRVSDTGCGIDKQDLNKILEPFGQSRTDAHLSQEGIGLGLSISRGLVELHGGTIEIESQIDIGTSITLRFPPERSII